MIATEQKNEIGAKAQGLIFLRDNHYLVPDFFLLNYGFLKVLPEEKTHALKLIETKIKEFSLNGQYYAVRSSATNEDGSKKSFAGQFKTLLNIPFQELPSAIWEVFMQYKNLDFNTYSDETKLSFGIIVQVLILPDYSGVGFSKNPFDADDERQVMNVVPGFGEDLVSGKLNAFSVIKGNKDYEFEDLTQEYEGKNDYVARFKNKQLGFEIKKSLEPILASFFSQLKALEKLKGCPIDVEFAIAHNKVYWLQVRPITTIGKKTVRIWDNTAAEANYYRITLPLTQSFVRRSLQVSYQAVGDKIKLDLKKLQLSEHIERMSDGINGVLYYNLTAWQTLIAQLPFGQKAAIQLPKIWGMEATKQKISVKTNFFTRLMVFMRLLSLLFQGKKIERKYYQNVNPIISQKINKDANFESLQQEYLFVEKNLGENWISPNINGIFTLFFLTLLKKTLTNSIILKNHPNFSNDVLQQQEVITIKIIHDFHELLRQIQQNRALYLIFEQENQNQILLDMKAKFPDFHTLFQNYINQYGVKAEFAELKLETISFAEDPKLLIAYLQKNKNLHSNILSSKLDYKSIINESYKFYNPKKYILLYLTKQAIKRVSNRENYRFDRTKAFAKVRQIFKLMGQRLQESNQLEQAEDVFFLKLEELLGSDTVNFKSIVARRKVEYEGFCKTKIVTRYKETIGGFEPVFFEYLDSDLKGIGCCSGVVCGEVIVLADDEQTMELSGKIVVANFVEPSNISLFAKASGILTARGNLLSHTAILCREMGVPSIVGVKGLLEKLKTGDRIEMNGATGSIILSVMKDE